MQLVIDGEIRHFVPIKQFREAMNLPETFGMALFEPKDYSGLGKIDAAGTELNLVRRAVVEAIPAGIPLHEWLAYLPNLTRLLENKLHEVNAEIGLKSVEIDYAVSGFENVIHSLIYTLIRAHSEGQPAPDFDTIYQEWLDSSVRIASTVHHYTHNGETWPVQIVINAYGRVGMMVWTEQKTHYIHANQLACPAEGFMLGLLSEVAERIMVATQSASSVSAQH